MDEEERRWGELWVTKAPPPQWPQDLGPLLERPDVASVRKASRSFKATTGLGIDSFRPRWVDLLSDGVVEQLISTLMLVERLCRCPALALAVCAGWGTLSW